MAAEYTFTCAICGFAVAWWDEGKQYIATPDGQRHYWYHPCENSQWERICSLFMENPSKAAIRKILRKHGGCERKFLCRACCGFSFIDPDKDPFICSSCSATDLVMAGELTDQECPACRRGIFGEPQCSAIS